MAEGWSIVICARQAGQAKALNVRDVIAFARQYRLSVRSFEIPKNLNASMDADRSLLTSDSRLCCLFGIMHDSEMAQNTTANRMRLSNFS